MRIIRASSKDRLIEFAALRLTRIINATLEHNDRFSLVLAGGSTPRPVYERLADPAYADAIDWERVYIFFGDERTVPPDHPDSNYGMAKADLFDRVPIPEPNIYRMRGEVDPTQAAALYEAEIRGYMKDDLGFDMVILGMGDDGHTASLFPGTAALNEKEKWVVANVVPQHDTTRLTMTLPLLNISENVMFLVAGDGKTERLKEVIDTAPPATYPAQLIQPQNNMVTWLVDQAAGALLDEVDEEI
ncbi:MAG: 6-phosphogluconolactonase [Anaerolineaceae bacterium]|nr:6-phosphogluconolactonase [Anaerolineaceae bacterium]